MGGKKIASLLMMFLLILTTGCSAEGKAENERTEPADKANMVSKTIIVDWVWYASADELIEASDKVILGTVTNVSFQILDLRTGKVPGAGVEDNCFLYTIYDIDTIKTYKGEPKEKEQVRIMGGVEGAYEDEQIAVLGQQEQVSIPYLEGIKKRIRKGETCLFMLAEYDDALPTIVNPQGIYNIKDVQTNGYEQDGEITAREIISSFGTNEWSKVKP